jgi:hypothetical protein
MPYEFWHNLIKVLQMPQVKGQALSHTSDYPAGVSGTPWN